MRPSIASPAFVSLVVPFALGLIACGDSGGTAGQEDSVGDETPTPPSDTQATSPGDTTTTPGDTTSTRAETETTSSNALEPSILVDINAEGVGWVSAGFFRSREGKHGALGCQRGNGPCLAASEWPEPGGFKVLTPRVMGPDQPEVLDVAQPFTLGSVALAPPPFGWLYEGTGRFAPGSTPVLAFDEGPLAPFSGTSGLRIPEPLVMLAPPPSTWTLGPTFADDVIELRWVPDDGDDPAAIYVLLEAQVDERREFPVAGPRAIWAFEDTGEAHVDLSGFTFSPMTTHVELFLVRQTTSHVDVGGVDVELFAREVRRWPLALQPIEGRTRIDAVATCGEAAPLLAAGTYYGRINHTTSALGNDVKACIGGEPKGAEGFLRVEVPPQKQLTLQYLSLPTLFSAIYLMSGCTLDTCLTGSGDAFGSSAGVPARWFNDGEQSTILTVVLDAMDQTGAYTLDVTLGDRRWIAAADTCEDVLEPLAAGRYQGQFVAMQGEIDPGTACGTQPAGGADVYFWIIVPPGKKLEVTYGFNHWDAVAYLLGECGNPGKCLAGADAEEVLSWTNAGTEDRDVFLVLDSQFTWPSASFFDLDVDIE